MARRRLGVVLLVPHPVATEVDGLRRGLGDRALPRIPPHVTLVPPVNVREDDLDAVLAALRAVAADHPAIEVDLGPAATFAPVSPVAYLAVRGADEVLDRLAAALRIGPLDRPRQHPFVPHCTIADDLDAARLATVVELLADYDRPVRFDLVTVLEEHQPGRVWLPLADLPFERAAGRVGQGGLAVEVEVTERLAPAAAALLEGTTWAVTARLDGVVVGAAWGTAGELVELRVVEDHRRLGIGRHLLAAVEAEARRRGAARLGATVPDDVAALALLAGAGWRDRGDGRWERWLGEA